MTVLCETEFWCRFLIPHFVEIARLPGLPVLVLGSLQINTGVGEPSASSSDESDYSSLKLAVLNIPDLNIFGLCKAESWCRFQFPTPHFVEIA